jgi:hypothetical protein
LAASKVEVLVEKREAVPQAARWGFVRKIIMEAGN